MIKIIDLYDKKEKRFKLTQFPDKTTQAWQIKDFYNLSENIEVLWKYENDSEFMIILQLGTLLSQNKSRLVRLLCPYLPYGRQDKEINNNTTFGKEVMINALKNAGYKYMTTFDAHSYHPFIFSENPSYFFETIYNHDYICVPDKGAYNRYLDIIKINLECVNILTGEKVRNQLTGQIEGIKIIENIDLSTKSVLVIDDLCDGGGTFIKLAKELKRLNCNNFDLAVSHGIFSKGKDILYDAGYNNIYTTNSLLSNTEEFRIF